MHPEQTANKAVVAAARPISRVLNIELKPGIEVEYGNDFSVQHHASFLYFSVRVRSPTQTLPEHSVKMSIGYDLVY